MSQYSTGLASTTNGSATVTGSGTLWLANVSAGDSFTVAGDGVMYDVASVDSDTQITLSAPYAGTTASGAVYTIARDFTSPDNFPELTTGDIETPTIITRAFRKIQSRFTGIAINTTAEIGQAVNDHVALADPHAQYLKESEYEAHRSREDLLKQATLSLDFANNKYEVYEGPVDGLTQMPFNEALDFTRASSATARTATGKIQEVLTDEQRLVGNREGLLIEEQRTNVITRSQPTVADNYWQALTDTTLSDVTLAGLPALRVTRDTGTGGLQALITNTQGNPNNECFRTMIVRVSDPANQYLKLRIAGESGNDYYTNDDRFHITFDLSSKTVVYTGSYTGTAEIKELSAKVFRITLNQTHISVALAAAGWAFRLSDQSDAGDYNTSQVPQGSWFEFTACQREELVGFPTSYIPTAGTQVTRAADDCVRVLGAEFNPNEFSFYLEAPIPRLFDDRNAHLIEFSDGSNNNRYLLRRGVNSTDLVFRGITPANGVIFTMTLGIAALSNQTAKISASVSSTSATLVVDGVSVSDTVSDALPVVTQFNLGAKWGGSNSIGEAVFKDVQLYPEALTEAELITLTGGT